MCMPTTARVHSSLAVLNTQALFFMTRVRTQNSEERCRYIEPRRGGLDTLAIETTNTIIFSRLGWCAKSEQRTVTHWARLKLVSLALLALLQFYFKLVYLWISCIMKKFLSLQPFLAFYGCCALA